MRAARTLFQVHIRRTGGTSIQRGLLNQFAVADCLLLAHAPENLEKQPDAFRYVTGHVPFAYVERFRRPPFVFTCLRDPIERALSVYAYFRSGARTHPWSLERELGAAAYRRRLAAMAAMRKFSLGELLRHEPEIAAAELGNEQVRVLAGTEGEPGVSHLQEARRNLERCDFVALSERLDESFLQLGERLGRPLGPIPWANASSERPRREQLEPSTLDALVAMTELDRELVEFARDLHACRAGAQARSSEPPGLEWDAPPPGDDFHFDQAIHGGGWEPREKLAEGPWFCWIGGGRRAWVDLSLGARRGDCRVRVEIAHVIEPSIVDGLRLIVDGSAIEHRLEGLEGALAVEGTVSGAAIAGNTVRIEIALARTARPCDVNPASDDRRDLGVAVRRVQLLP